MKRLLGLLLVLASAVAVADPPVALYQTRGFGNLKQFYAVGNDQGLQINIIQSTTYPSTYLTIVEPDGITTIRCSAASGLVLACDDGKVRTLVLNEVSATVNKRNPARYWTLLGGMIITAPPAPTGGIGGTG